MYKKLNNKGYMLIEIILASALAMGVAYFITDLTIKLKNKNDDLMVKTLVATDQAIMYNVIMEDIYNGNEFKCSNLEINGNVFRYKTFTNVISDYATLSDITCSDSGQISVNIPMTVKQLSEDYSVKINSSIKTQTDSSGSSSSGSSSGNSTVSYYLTIKLTPADGFSSFCYTNGSDSKKCSTVSGMNWNNNVASYGIQNVDASGIYYYGVPAAGYSISSCTSSRPCFLDRSSFTTVGGQIRTIRAIAD